MTNPQKIIHFVPGGYNGETLLQAVCGEWVNPYQASLLITDCPECQKIKDKQLRHCKNCGYLAEDWAAGTGKHFCSHPGTDFVGIDFDLTANPAQDCDFFESRDCNR